MILSIITFVTMTLSEESFAKRCTENCERAGLPLAHLVYSDMCNESYPNCHRNINSYTIYDYPLKLQNEGLNPEHIKCFPNMKLIFKSTNNLGYCVDEKSVEKLLERGWGKLSI